MSFKYAYWSFTSALNNETCDKIIQQGLSQIEEAKKQGFDVSATTHGHLHKQAKPNAIPLYDKPLNDYLKESDTSSENIYIRDSDICWINDEYLYNMVWPYIKEANIKAGWQYDLDWSESFQFTVYKPGGFYNWHQDGSYCHFSKYKKLIPGITNTDDTSNGHFTTNHKFVGKVRKLSVTINLCDPKDYEGGNLKFDFGPHSQNERYHECEEIRPRGSIIVFPSAVYHQVTPVTKGTRYSLVLWCLGKPFR
jgi:PKHD-type hydroxylase